MHFRTLIPLTFTLLALAAAAACGGDDDSAVSPTASDSTESATPTEVASETPVPTPMVTAPLFVTPNRSLPPADHTAIGVIDVLTFLEPFGTPTSVECSGIDLEQGIIDCAAQGYGTIAVDPIPTGGTDWLCAAKLDAAGTLIAASCSGHMAGFIWAIQD